LFPYDLDVVFSGGGWGAVSISSNGGPKDAVLSPVSSQPHNRPWSSQCVLYYSVYEVYSRRRTATIHDKMTRISPPRPIAPVQCSGELDDPAERHVSQHRGVYRAASPSADEGTAVPAREFSQVWLPRVLCFSRPVRFFAFTL